VEYTHKHAARVKAFNERLRRAGSSLQFEADPGHSHDLVGVENEIRHRHFIAADDDGVVRGAYTLISQQFSIVESLEQLSFLQIPISEGIVNPAFGAVGLFLLKDALRRSPFLFGLGMGGIDRPLPKLFRLLGAEVREVPFYFLVASPPAFLRNTAALRKTPGRRIASEVAASSGLGDLAIGILNRWRGRAAIRRKRLQFDVVREFPDCVDEVWSAVRSKYSLISVRNRETLEYLYPFSDSRYRRLLVRDGSRPVGWALVTDSQMRGHNHFGDMRVGAVVNCLSLPAEEDVVIGAATAFLRESGVDLIVSNQSHRDWGKAFERAGYSQHRSNFVFASAKALTRRIRNVDVNLERIYLNRGDGDGAYNL